jgi:hypothetical protein
MDDTFDKLKEALDKITPAEFKWKEEYPEYDIGLSESTDSIADTIDISTIGSLTTAQLPAFTTSNSPYANVTVNSAGSAGSYLYSNGSSSSWANVTLGSIGATGPSSPLQVKGDAEFEGKVKINGQDLAEFMDTISKRLTILVPDPEKLEHFAALKKAYEHYKTLEALCQMPKKDGE